jgi:hypothetical protein
MNFEAFFDKLNKPRYQKNHYAGGILHHWEWDNVDKVDEIGNFLIKNGYTFQNRYPADGVVGGAMHKNETRVEYNTGDSKNTFSVEYFDGNGNMYCKHYYHSDKLNKSIDFVKIISIIGSIASIIGVILTIIFGENGWR